MQSDGTLSRNIKTDLKNPTSWFFILLTSIVSYYKNILKHKNPNPLYRHHKNMKTKKHMYSQEGKEKNWAE
jgi:hypothetical protein